jgi:glycerol-3-phosphate dehydrogenase
MAEDTIDEVIKVAGLKQVPCATASLKIHGYSENGTHDGHLEIYGSDASGVRALAGERPELNQRLHPAFPHIKAEVVWAVHREMARTVEDVLARRLRILFLNARAAMDMAPEVAGLMASELGFDQHWQQRQVKDFLLVAGRYLLQVSNKPAMAEVTRSLP